VADPREPVGGPELLLTLEKHSELTLHEQLERALRDHIRTGRLPLGSRLPSSRALAAELGISRGVVLEAYSQLVAEGYLTSSQGAPTRVAFVPAVERPPIPAAELDARHRYRLDPFLPDLGAFPRGAWLRSMRAAIRDASFAELGHGDPRGTVALRNALMTYVARARSAAPEPEHTLVCAGWTQGFALLCRALRARGVERIACEDPGWAQHGLVAQQAGLEPVPLPVDGQGIDVGMLERSGCEAVLVTAAHQFPTGAVLSSERRAALLEWAEDTDGLIVEDDYDSELRYDRGAVGALQGLAPERVCMIGSLSVRLAPGLRLGWVLSPSWLTGALAYEKALGDAPAPALEQLALADFIARGELDRHLRRMRARYSARRGVLLAGLGGAPVSGVAAGVFTLVWLPPDTDEEALVTAAAARGIGVEGLARHRVGDGPPGLIIGYACLSEPALERGVATLTKLVPRWTSASKIAPAW
jgi:GntR family transcriptional regulator / MocR family aminotransferase